MNIFLFLPRLKYALAVVLFVCTGVVYSSTIGEDGLHKQDWFSITFRDVAEDISDSSAEGKRVVYIFEQRGCIYCARMHESTLSDPEVAEYLKENYNVVQFNLFGDEEVTDMDGEVLTEKTAARKWGVVFTPTMLFMPDKPVDGASAGQAAVSRMPGAFGKHSFLHLFQWVNEKGYEGEEHFQKYHASKIAERRAAGKAIEE